jgi:hypothetical protein
VSERIIVNGDTHAGQTVHGSTADSVHASFIPRYLAFSPTQVFNTGDQVENGGSNAHWDLFDGHIAPLEVRDTFTITKE